MLPYRRLIYQTRLTDRRTGTETQTERHTDTETQAERQSINRKKTRQDLSKFQVKKQTWRRCRTFFSEHLRHELLGEVLSIGGHASTVLAQDLVPLILALKSTTNV